MRGRLSPVLTPVKLCRFLCVSTVLKLFVAVVETLCRIYVSNDLVSGNSVHNFSDAQIEGVEIPTSFMCPLRTLTDEVLNGLLLH